jgi:hypothetical protein
VGNQEQVNLVSELGSKNYGWEISDARFDFRGPVRFPDWKRSKNKLILGGKTS